jgi:hypothetical protein
MNRTNVASTRSHGNQAIFCTEGYPNGKTNEWDKLVLHVTLCVGQYE